MTAIAHEPQGNLALAAVAGRQMFDDSAAAVLYEPRGASECAAAVAALVARFAAAGGTVTQIVENARAAALRTHQRRHGAGDVHQAEDLYARLYTGGFFTRGGYILDGIAAGSRQQPAAAVLMADA